MRSTMNERTGPAALWVGLALTLLTASPALAEDSTYRRAMMERALNQGSGRSEVESLSITITSDRQERADQLRELAASGQFGRLLSLHFDAPTQEGKKTLSFVAEQGYLQVYADGSHFKLRGDLDKVTPVEAS